VTIPMDMDIESAALFAFLRSMCPEDNSRRVPAELRSFLDWQEKLFGPADVRVYRPRPTIAREGTAARGVLFFLGATAAGGVWMIGSAWWGQGWLAGGGATVLLGGLLAFLCWLGSRRNALPARQRQSACLIVSPGGLALIQGPLKGELKWAEVQDLKLRNQGIEIKVAGAAIQVVDGYDAGLGPIHETMRRLWLEGRIRR
jgi:hypothetical protein